METEMELSWPIKLRIALAAAVGIGIIGLYAWPLVAPVEPFGVVSIGSGTISSNDVFILAILAFFIGLISYFLSWPYGSQIGILAAPAGLAALAIRSSDMGTLLQLNPSVVKREEIFSMMSWEPLLWLIIVAAGFLGAFVASEIIHPVRPAIVDKLMKRDFGYFLNLILTIIGSIVITQFFIGIFARDFSIADSQAGNVIAQPAMGQIIFAVLVSFGLTGFLAKKFLNLDYLSVIISTCLVTPFSIMVYGKPETIANYAGRWPPIFFPNVNLAILPIQIVAFGTLGAIAGYWIAVRYDYWKKLGY
jgi:hypothetical protein